MADDPLDPNQDDESGADTPVMPVEDATGAGNLRKKSRINREQREADSFWIAVFDSKIGRREMWNIIASSNGAHAFETRFMAGSVGFPDANATWYALGEQLLGLRLYQSWLKRFPEKVALMHAENDPNFSVPKRQGTGG